MEKPLINKVANSGLNVFNLEDHYPTLPFTSFDLKPYLFKELILKEKDFRASLKEIDWSIYKNSIVLIFNSNDAIIPVWAFMLVSTYLNDFAAEIFQGTQEEYLKLHYSKVIQNIDPESFNDQRVIIKGCSHKPVPAFAYTAITYKLKPFAKSIMYGEPCSTVPIYKKPRVVTSRLVSE
jgi:hypothetical protein